MLLELHQLGECAAQHDLLRPEGHQVQEVPRELQQHADDAHDSTRNAQLDIPNSH